VSARVRVLVLVVLAVVLTSVAVGYVLVRRADNQGSAAGGLVDFNRSGTLVVRDLRPGPSHGHLVQLDPDDAHTRVRSANICARVYAVRGHGVCLRPSTEAAGAFEVAFLDRRGRVTSSFPLVGTPSRTRISADGRLFSWTVFVQGDSYNDGHFSTRSGTYDARNDDLVGTLEDWKVTVDGKRYRAIDLNFWGLTFANDDRTFYATMATKGQRYLVRGDMVDRTIVTLHANVECPSLSPDQKRVAYKKRYGNRWRFAVLELSTGKETRLSERRSVDDQLAWFDDDTLLYGVRRGARHADVWSMPADGTGKPVLVAADAESPAPIRAP